MRNRCHVYVICYDGMVAPTKIGIAYNVKKRLCGLQISNPNKLVIFKSFPFLDGGVARDIELLSHKLLKDKNIRGEWFDVPPEKAAEAVESAASRVSNVSQGKLYHTMITKHERSVLDFILDFFRKNNNIPDIRAIESGTRIPYRRIFILIASLQKKGYLDFSRDKSGNLTGLKIYS